MNEIMKQYKEKYEPLPSGLSHWEIKRLIGEGNFGKVFKITRSEFGVQYSSALKIIHVSVTKSEKESMRMEGMTERDIQNNLKKMMEATVKEIELMYRLRKNKYVVQFEEHEIRECKDGLGWDIFIRMELLTSLNQHIQKHYGTITKREIIQLGIDVCKALEEYQKYNIIHQDIKAENIFISKEGNFKLGDFGIARMAEKKVIGFSKKGTGILMAPEVQKGKEYDSSVDIYCLGMVMYRLMNNNRPPFYKPYPQMMNLDDRDRALVLRMSGEKFPQPNEVGLCRLTEIVSKACAYRPEDRYSSPMFMRQELEAILYKEGELRTGEVIRIYDVDRIDNNEGSSKDDEEKTDDFPIIKSPKQENDEENLIVEMKMFFAQKEQEQKEKQERKEDKKKLMWINKGIFGGKRR